MIIGFIGAGHMGGGMAQNLIRAGHTLRLVAHRQRARVDALCKEGARETADPGRLAGEADVIFLCLPNADIVRDVVGELMPHLGRCGLIIDTSTSLPGVSASLAHALSEQSVDFVDAPVNGDPDQARAGQLGSMVGGTEKACERALPLIEAYSRTVVRFGGPGAGNAAKLINNFITLGQVGLIVEAFRRCDRLGIDRGSLYELLKNGAANSGTLNKMLPSALEGSFDGHKFSLENATKDALYVDRMAKDLGEDSAFALAIKQFFTQESTRRAGNEFLSALLRP